MRFLASLVSSFAALLISAAPARADDVDRAQAAAAPGTVDDTLVVHVKGVGSAVVEARSRDGTWTRVCATPCDRPLSSHALYRVNGPSMKASRPFRLAGDEPVELVVEPASIAGRVVGSVLAGGGSVVFVVGLLNVVDSAFTFCGFGETDDDAPCRAKHAGAGQTATMGRTLILAGAGVAIVGALVFAATAGSETRVGVAPNGKREEGRARVEPRTAASFAPPRDAQSGVPAPKLPFMVPLLSGSF